MPLPHLSQHVSPLFLLLLVVAPVPPDLEAAVVLGVLGQVPPQTAVRGTDANVDQGGVLKSGCDLLWQKLGLNQLEHLFRLLLHPGVRLGPGGDSDEARVAGAIKGLGADAAGSEYEA